MLSRFLPKNAQFYDHFRQAAQVAEKTARAFAELLADYREVEAKVKAIRELEHQGDDISRAVGKALTQTYITPIDREDIVALAGALDDFIDAIEEAARHMRLYRIEKPTEPTREASRLLLRQAELLVEAMNLLVQKDDRLLEKTAEVRAVEDDADRLNDRAMARLYDGVTEVPELIVAMRLGELYGYLEDAADEAQDVAKVLESIALKNA
jgi:predicted phosphate transport protein (TIGR00153 family)